MQRNQRYYIIRHSRNYAEARPQGRREMHYMRKMRQHSEHAEAPETFGGSDIPLKKVDVKPSAVYRLSPISPTTCIKIQHPAYPTAPSIWKVNILKSVAEGSRDPGICWIRTRSTGCHSPIASKHSIRKEQP